MKKSLPRAVGNKQFRPDDHYRPCFGTAAAQVAKRTADATVGRITVKFFTGGTLGHPLKANEAVREGTADMYRSAEMTDCLSSQQNSQCPVRS